MIKHLSSLKLTTILLVGLVAVLLLGFSTSFSDSIYSDLRKMNDYLLLEWFVMYGCKNIILLVWLIVLFILAFLFGVNLVLCTWENLLKSAIKNRSLKSLLLFSAHVIFTIILVLHAISFFIGFKYGDINLTEGEEYVFKNNYKLKVQNIQFVDDIKILKSNKKSSRQELTKNNFHYKNNFASIGLSHNNKTILDGNVYVFDPLVNNGIQVTIEKFIIDKKTENIGVKLTLTKNPLLWYFIIFYALGILTLLAYTIVRWNCTYVFEKRKINQE